MPQWRTGYSVYKKPVASGDTLTVAPPTGYQAGDPLVAVWSHDKHMAGVPVTIQNAPGDGWKAGRFIEVSAGVAVMFFWKNQAAGGGATSDTLVIKQGDASTSNTQDSLIIMKAGNGSTFTGVPRLDVSTLAVSAAGNNQSLNSGTTAAMEFNDGLALAFMGADSAAGVNGAGSTDTLSRSWSNGFVESAWEEQNTALTIAEREITTGGTWSTTWTTTDTGDEIAVGLLILKSGGTEEVIGGGGGGGGGGTALRATTGPPTVNGDGFHAAADVSGATLAKIRAATNSALTTGVVDGQEVSVNTTDGIAKASITGLTPGTQYYYGWVLDGTLASGGRGEVLLPSLTTGASLKITHHSCQGSGSNNAAAAVPKARNTNIHLFLGDRDYHDRNSPDYTVYLADIRANLDLSNQAVLYGLHMTAYQVSDHELANDGDGTMPGVTGVRESYRKRIPHHSSLAASGDLGHSFPVRFGGKTVWIFMCDTRTARDPRSTANGPSKTMLGATQLARLLQFFDDHPDEMKIVTFDGNWLGDPLDPALPKSGSDSSSGDNWREWRHERQTIVNHIINNNIRNGMFMWGDQHVVAYENGTNSYGTGWPSVCAAGFSVTSSIKGYPYNGGTLASYTQGPIPDAAGVTGLGQFGELVLTESGNNIVMNVQAYDASQTPLYSGTNTYTFTDAVAAPTEALRPTATGSVTNLTPNTDPAAYQAIDDDPDSPSSDWLTGTNPSGTLTTPSIRSVGTQQASVTSPLTVTLPTHATNDIILLEVVGRTAGTIGCTTTGWALVPGSRVVNGTTIVSELWWKRASSAAETSPVVTYSAAATNGYSVTPFVLMDCPTSGNPWDVLNTQANAAAATQASPTITTTTNGCRILHMWATADDNALSVDAAITTGYSGANYDTTTGSDHAVAMGHEAQASAGLTTSRTATETAVGNDVGVARTIAFLPSGTPGSTVNTEVRAAMQNPTATLATGANTGEVRVLVRKLGNGFNPTTRVELYETTDLANLGTLKATVIPNTATAAATVLSGRFDQSLITNPNNVVFRVVGTGAQGGLVEIGALEWNAEVVSGPTALLRTAVSHANVVVSATNRAATTKARATNSVVNTVTSSTARTKSGIRSALSHVANVVSGATRAAITKSRAANSAVNNATAAASRAKAQVRSALSWVDSVTGLSSRTKDIARTATSHASIVTAAASRVKAFTRTANSHTGILTAVTNSTVANVIIRTAVSYVQAVTSASSRLSASSRTGLSTVNAITGNAGRTAARVRSAVSSALAVTSASNAVADRLRTANAFVGQVTAYVGRTTLKSRTATSVVNAVTSHANYATALIERTANSFVGQVTTSSSRVKALSRGANAHVQQVVATSGVFKAIHRKSIAWVNTITASSGRVKALQRRSVAWLNVITTSSNRVRGLVRSTNAHVAVITATSGVVRALQRRSVSWVNSVTSSATASTIVTAFRTAISHVQSVTASSRRVTQLNKTAQSWVNTVTSLSSASVVLTIYRSALSHVNAVTSNSARFVQVRRAALSHAGNVTSVASRLVPQKIRNAVSSVNIVTSRTNKLVNLYRTALTFIGNITSGISRVLVRTRRVGSYSGQVGSESSRVTSQHRNSVSSVLNVTSRASGLNIPPFLPVDMTVRVKAKKETTVKVLT